MSLPALVLAGFAASLGRTSRPVTARLTYSARQAVQGGMIFAVGAVSDSDEDAVRMSQAVILASGGLLSRGAAWARAHGSPAVVLPGARWEGGRLLVEEPVFGPAQQGGGVAFEPVREVKRRVIVEGEIVGVDAAAGTVTVYPPKDQQGELELAQALEAYAGLRDGPALIHWWQARGGVELAARLASELAARAVDGEGRAEDFASLGKAVSALLPAADGAQFRQQASSAAARQARRARALLGDVLQDLEAVSSEEAARALAARADSLCGALEVLNAGGSFAPCRRARALTAARLGALAGRSAISWQQAAQAAGARARPGAVVGADVYARFVSGAGLGPKIDDFASDASLPLALKSERIRALFHSAKLPDGPAGPGPFDFSCEDGSRDGVSKADAPGALLDCWAGFWSPGPLGRRKRAGVVNAAPQVLVSPSLSAAVSGAFFSRSPGSAARLFVAAGGGQYLLDRSGVPLLPPILGGEKAALSAGQLKRLAKVARALENHFGGPAEAEFAFEGDALYVASARASR